jgi:hypothetical protein
MKNPFRFLQFFFSLIILFVAFGCKGENNNAGQDATVKSLKKINDYPFYTMNYYGNYGFKNFLNTGQYPSFSADRGLLESNFSCTCFAAMGNDSCKIFGRNFDFTFHIAILLFTDPEDGYASVSMNYLPALDFSNSNPPDPDRDRAQLLMLPYFPLDGMNECGLAVGIMAVDKTEPPYSANRISLTQLEAVRLLLDYAKDIDEAINLIGKYNIDFGANPGHFLIADSTGHSAIIEFVKKEMKVIRNTEKWQICTNFIVTGTNAPNNVGCWRYNKGYSILKTNRGIISDKQAMDILNNVAQGPPYNTMWSMVYNLKTIETGVAIDRNFSEIYNFKIKPY